MLLVRPRSSGDGKSGKIGSGPGQQKVSPTSPSAATSLHIVIPPKNGASTPVVQPPGTLALASSERLEP